MRKINVSLCIASVGMLFLASCSTVPSTDQSATSSQRVRVEFSQIPGWSSDTLSQAMPAFNRSCQVLQKQDKWQNVCLQAKQIDVNNEQVVRNFFEQNFNAYQITKNQGETKGLATGYYEPLIKGSRTKKGIYQSPLCKPPSDFLIIDLASQYPKLKGMRLRGKLQGNRVVPYDTRGELENSDKLKGYEIVWVEPYDAYDLSVQGSGRVYIDDTGETIRVAYENQNGHPWRSIARYLIAQGELSRDQASSQRIRQWLKKHPKRRKEVFAADPSYVFFREEKVEDVNIGPKGSLGVPLTPRRSIAVDPRYVALGTPVFVQTTMPGEQTPLEQLMMAQDTGGAIKGPIRADFFWGTGHSAGQIAGRMRQSLSVWVLEPK